VIRPLRRTYVAVVRWTDELLWGGHKWVCRFEALCVCTRWTDEREWSRCLGSMEPGLLSRSPSNFGWPEPKHFKWWSRSLKFGFRFHSPSLLSKRVVQIMRRSSVFNRLNRLEPELINLGRSSAGWMPARIGRLSAGLGRRHPVTIRKASLMVGSMRRVWALRHHTGAQYSAVEWTRARVTVRNVVAPAPQPEPASRLRSATRYVSFLRSDSRCRRYVNDLSKVTPRYLGSEQKGRVSLFKLTFSSRLASWLLRLKTADTVCVVLSISFQVRRYSPSVAMSLLSVPSTACMIARSSAYAYFLEMVVGRSYM